MRTNPAPARIRTDTLRRIRGPAAVGGRMLGRNHMTVGYATYAAAAAAVVHAAPSAVAPLAPANPIVFLAMLPLVGYMALLPDIDEPKARLVQRAPIYKPISEFIGLLTHHRGGTHTAWAILVVALTGAVAAFLAEWTVLWTVAFAATWGYMSHIVLGDMWTKSGVALLAPVAKHHFGLLPKRLRFVTGTRPEWGVVAATVVVCVVLVARLGFPWVQLR
jgi:membrane-bound metal-dependent hydrolase YbcI (DUF457 family)